VVIGDHFAPGEEAECTGRSIGGIRSGRKWCNILLPATIWVRDVLTFGGNDLPCDVRCLPGRIGVQRGDAQLAAATELAHGDSLCRQTPAQLVDVGPVHSGGRGDLVIIHRLGATGRDDVPDHPCHGDGRRPIPVVFTGQTATYVRLCPAVQSRHRNASLLILKSSLLILRSGVRNNALSGLWLAAGPVASICPIASGDSSTSSSHHSPD